MIVIHIGLRKAGSTSIQSFLVANEVALRELSVDFARVGRLDRNAHHNIYSELTWRSKFEKKYGSLAELAEHIKSSGHQTTIISSELFEASDVAQVSLLRRALSVAGQPFRIVLVVRNLLDLLPSSYFQKIRGGVKVYSFDEFFEHRIGLSRTNCFNPAKIWAEVFGWDAIRVRLLDTKHLLRGDLVSDFLATAGQSPDMIRDNDLKTPAPANTSSGWKIQEAVRALHGGRHGLEMNHPLVEFLEVSRPKLAWSLDIAAAQAGEQCGWMADRGLYLTRDQAERALEVFTGAIASLNERLADKLPTPADLATRGFVERPFLPDVDNIPPAQLREFYEELYVRLAKSPESVEPAEGGKKIRRDRDTVTRNGTTYSLPDIEAALRELPEHRRARLVTIIHRGDGESPRGPVALIEASDFFQRTDHERVRNHVRDHLGLRDFNVRFVPPHFLVNASAGKIDRTASARRWTELIGAAAIGGRSTLGRGVGANARAPKEGPLRIVSLADHLNMRELDIAQLERLSERLGTPVHFEHVCAPPTPVLLSDTVFTDYFAPRAPDPTAYAAVARVVDTLRSADLILIDDRAELHYPTTQFYPVLSHRLRRSPDADLLAFRRQSYVDFHHRLPIAVVDGADLSLEHRDLTIAALSRYLDVPILRIATTRSMEQYTADWDYRPLQKLVGGLDTAPLDPDGLINAIVPWIRAMSDGGRIRLRSGSVGARIADTEDPASFGSQAIDRASLERILDHFGSFCIVGHPASVAFIPQYLDAAAKPYHYAASLLPKAIAAAGPFDCLLSCGAFGRRAFDYPAVAVMDAGWRQDVMNLPPSLDVKSVQGRLPSCDPSQWYSDPDAQSAVRKRAFSDAA
jgi:hypothetical protein